MTTPIFDYLNEYAASNFSRLHMPGHKGVPFCRNHPLAAVFPYDITEVTGADVLFCPDGIIEQSEANTAMLYDAAHTSFSTGGSTACIQTMLRLVASPGDTVIAARNVHCSFINACALLDIRPKFIMPSSGDYISGAITARSVRMVLERSTTAFERSTTAFEQRREVKAVYLTSPDYLGVISDIAGVASVCSEYGIPLIVDNAHGAAFKFLPVDIHPLSLGATMCCDSAHKTLPALTGGAYLHVGHGSNISKAQVKLAMSLFASTSPSYLTLLSLDLVNRYLQTDARAEFDTLVKTVDSLKDAATAAGFTPLYGDQTKLTLDATQVSMTGEQLKAHLAEFLIEPEYTSERYVVLMFSPQSSAIDIGRVATALKAIKKAPSLGVCNEIFDAPEAAVSIREAVFGESVSILVDQAEGRIAAQTKLICPPAIPLVIPGERINKKTQQILKKSSIFEISVLK